MVLRASLRGENMEFPVDRRSGGPQLNGFFEKISNLNMLSTDARASRGRMITGTGGQCTVIVDQSGRASTRGTRTKKRKQKCCQIFVDFQYFPVYPRHVFPTILHRNSLGSLV